ncbi:aminopeptidase [Sulfuriroseicoccus oceanibius]|uniref:Aminopeptidase n=1 Tax=Sulfuriroseicoccus oceanibius TaxID=2707525 RepID=A0A6B3LAA5_9BACT|nr:aminopeptidase [Sulfuriroseicoccus oceanibius]QQL43783.1 aminopeptidase [Sulfuriroseicoccus oceanibius]
MDPRIPELARQLIRYSVELKRGESVLLDLHDCPDELAIALIREAKAVKAAAFVNLHHSRVSRELAISSGDDYLDIQAGLLQAQMEKMDAYIAVRGAFNISEMNDVPAKTQQKIMEKMRPIQNYRVNNTRWCVLRWPTPSMAQQASMSTEAFEDFYYRVCLLDYKAMKPAMNALKRVMDQAEDVRITGPGTDLTFSIKGLGSQVCGGHRNIPDGEVFTAPVKNSVNGTLTYNTPTVYRGTSFDNVVLEFEHGKIVKATSNNTKELNKILNSDPGARYIGEFALGFNREILYPMRDILFDEKIAGSFHFTPGQAYEGDADNGNRSQVHWDMVCIQRPDYGGGEIYFDGKLIRKDGQFVPKSLQKLNY